VLAGVGGSGWHDDDRQEAWAHDSGAGVGPRERDDHHARDSGPNDDRYACRDHAGRHNAHRDHADHRYARRGRPAGHGGSGHSDDDRAQHNRAERDEHPSHPAARQLDHACGRHP
jgi:hypothetical protein